jgi:hypothetical protein
MRSTRNVHELLFVTLNDEFNPLVISSRLLNKFGSGGHFIHLSGVPTTSGPCTVHMMDSPCYCYELQTIHKSSNVRCSPHVQVALQSRSFISCQTSGCTRSPQSCDDACASASGIGCRGYSVSGDGIGSTVTPWAVSQEVAAEGRGRMSLPASLSLWMERGNASGTAKPACAADMPQQVRHPRHS